MVKAKLFPNAVHEKALVKLRKDLFPIGEQDKPHGVCAYLGHIPHFYGSFTLGWRGLSYPPAHRLVQGPRIHPLIQLVANVDKHLQKLSDPVTGMGR